jgi:hypothetical protein
MDYLVPVLAVDANGQSAGKSLVVRTIHWIIAGKEPKMIAFEANIAEVDKGIKASLVHGAKSIVVDNIVGHFRSSVLASLVTSKEPSIRMLGSFNQPQILHRADYCLNGNNLEFDSDMSKRIIWSKMWHPDPGSRKNTDYQVWKDHGTDLVSHLATNWLTYLDAAITIIQAWRNAGMPKQNATSPLDKYRTWECNIGGMLQFVGAEGFLSKHQERMTEANEELQEIIRFMDNIENRFPVVKDKAKGVPVKTLAELFYHADLKGTLSGVGGGSVEQVSILLGKCLSRKYGMIINGRVMSRRKTAAGNNFVISHTTN